jgi:hypothetical protein
MRGGEFTYYYDTVPMLVVKWDKHNSHKHRNKEQWKPFSV